MSYEYPKDFRKSHSLERAKKRLEDAEEALKYYTELVKYRDKQEVQEDWWYTVYTGAVRNYAVLAEALRHNVAELTPPFQAGDKVRFVGQPNYTYEVVACHSFGDEWAIAIRSTVRMLENERPYLAYADEYEKVEQMLGRFEQNARVLVKSLGEPATVIDVIHVPSCSQPVYSVLLDEAIVSMNTIVDKILCAEDMLEPLWFPTDIKAHELVRWLSDDNLTHIGRVMKVYDFPTGPEYVVVDTAACMWRINKLNNPRKVVVETQGTEPMPKW